MIQMEPNLGVADGRAPAAWCIKVLGRSKRKNTPPLATRSSCRSRRRSRRVRIQGQVMKAVIVHASHEACAVPTAR